MKVGTALEGVCQFGDKTHALRIVDGNGNFKAGDKMKAVLKDDKLFIAPEDQAATVMVENGTATGDGLLVYASPDTARGSYLEHALRPADHRGRQVVQRGNLGRRDQGAGQARGA